jgi:Zn-finger nucleic acid-binding protein
MEATEDSGVTVDRCENCGGTWFDDRELAKTLRSFAAMQPAGAVNPGQHDSLSILCPRCRVATQEYDFAYDSGVLVNECPACRGVFLQKGEFEQIAAFKAKLAAAAMESARYATRPPVEQPERLLELIQSKKLFVSAIVVLLCLAMAITGRVADTVATLGVRMIFPLICFWFADSFGKYFGLRFGPFRFPAREPTPAIAIAIVAWFCLFALFATAIVL